MTSHLRFAHENSAQYQGFFQSADRAKSVRKIDKIIAAVTGRASVGGIDVIAANMTVPFRFKAATATGASLTRNGLSVFLTSKVF
jgi:hypothetical protein